MRTVTSVTNPRIQSTICAGVRPQQAGRCSAPYGHSTSRNGTSVPVSGVHLDCVTKYRACPTGSGSGDAA